MSVGKTNTRVSTEERTLQEKKGMAKAQVIENRIEREILVLKEMIKRRNAGEQVTDFDLRGDLYASAMELAPNARMADIRTMQEWLNLRGDESVADLAAGTGFLTRHIRSWTTGNVVAVDPAAQALAHLVRVCGDSVQVIVGSPDDPNAMRALPAESMEVTTSFGGLHHVARQRTMMEQITRVLKPGGRFVAGDVGGGTPLACHFDDVTTAKCLTGHSAQWLTPLRLHDLVDGLPLTVVRAEIVPLQWVFASAHEMAIFFKGLHAYDLPEEEIVQDLRNVLGCVSREGQIFLNWHMLLFEMRRV